MADGWWHPEALDRQRLAPLVSDAVERARAARDRDAFPHALLLVGPAGLGRELAAVEIAALLVCSDLDQPWLDTPAARRVRSGTHPDVTAVHPTGAAGRIAIAQVRELVDAAAGRPFEGERRVWILAGVEAGRFGAEAANAFLKTLEEPPPHVVFLLLAENPTAVLPTIRSRCQRLLLPGPSAAAARLGLDRPAPELRVGGDDAASLLVEARTALEAALDGEVRPMLRLSETLPSDADALSIVAAASLSIAAASSGERADELTRLAADLLRLEHRSRRLNLAPGRQLVARLAALVRDA